MVDAENIYIEAYREKKREYARQYRKDNVEKVRKYKESVRDRDSARKSERVVCECGCQVTKGTLPKHRRTEKHQLFMSSKDKKDVAKDVEPEVKDDDNQQFNVKAPAICECGVKYTMGNQAKHLRTMKHANLMKLIEKQ